MTRSVPAAAAFVIALVLAGSNPATGAPAPSKAKVHGVALSGRISRMNSAKMTFSVQDGAGREVALSWTSATKITGGDLKTGEAVTLRYFDRDSKHIAATIHVGAPAAPATRTASAAAPVSPASAATPVTKNR